MTTLRFHAPYMEWAKTRPSARFDLAGSNILPCPIDELPGAREAIGFEGSNENGYGPLIESIASHYEVGTDHVTTAQGASGANFLAFAALLEPGDEVLVETPGYDPLLGAPRMLGARVNQFEREFVNGFALDPERVRRAITPRTRIIIITNPHNPSGVLAASAALDAIGEIARAHGAHVLLDEVYLDLAAASAALRGVNVERTFARRGEPFVCTNSLTNCTACRDSGAGGSCLRPMSRSAFGARAMSWMERDPSSRSVSPWWHSRISSGCFSGHERSST